MRFATNPLTADSVSELRHPQLRRYLRDQCRALSRSRSVGEKAHGDKHNAQNSVEKFTVEVAGVFKPDLRRLIKEHGFNNQQEVYQNLLRNVIAAEFETAAVMLRSVTTPFIIVERCRRSSATKACESCTTHPVSQRTKLFARNCFELIPSTCQLFSSVGDMRLIQLHELAVALNNLTRLLLQCALIDTKFFGCSKRCD